MHFESDSNVNLLPPLEAVLSQGFIYMEIQKETFLEKWSSNFFRGSIVQHRYL